jgi:cytochrome c oxidase subunit 3
MSEHGSYYVPEYSRLPFFAALGLFCLGFGSLKIFDIGITGWVIFSIGGVIMATVLFAWFREIIRENNAGLHDAQMNRSYRWGMFWFIFADLCLFAIMLGGLLYARFVTIPDLGGIEGNENSILTNILLWPNFHASWPLLTDPNPVAFPSPSGVLNPWGIPILNTLVLLLSGVSISWASWALKHNKRGQMITGILGTIILGLLFLGLQIFAFKIMSVVLHLKISSGIYGGSLYMLLSFHAAHVVVGLGILLATLFRVLKGHFATHDHFGFEATVWYWQYIDVLWLFIFIIVYWL